MFKKLYLPSLFLILFACKKYEEGPLFSIKSKTERIVNTWRVEKAIKAAEDITTEYEGYRITFTKEGYYFFFIPMQSANYYGNATYTGEWEFDSSKEKVLIEYSGNQIKTVYKEFEILKLKENQLWLKDIGENTELRLIPS